jgi:hypothetical protein
MYFPRPKKWDFLMAEIVKKGTPILLLFVLPIIGLIIRVSIAFFTKSDLFDLQVLSSFDLGLIFESLECKIYLALFVTTLYMAWYSFFREQCPACGSADFEVAGRKDGDGGAIKNTANDVKLKAERFYSCTNCPHEWNEAVEHVMR